MSKTMANVLIFSYNKTFKKEAANEDFEEISHDLKIKHVMGITDAPNYENDLHAIVVKDKKAKKKRKKHQPIHVYITSLPWKSALAVYQGYRTRWVIENNAIKEH